MFFLSARHLEKLGLSSEGADWPVAEIAKGLRAPRLRFLDLPSGGAQGPAAWMELARKPGVQRLEVLQIWNGAGNEAEHADFEAALRKSLPDVCVYR